jgi:hypothetical protein
VIKFQTSVDGVIQSTYHEIFLNGSSPNFLYHLICETMVPILVLIVRLELGTRGPPVFSSDLTGGVVKRLILLLSVLATGGGSGMGRYVSRHTLGLKK